MPQYSQIERIQLKFDFRAPGRINHLKKTTKNQLKSAKKNLTDLPVEGAATDHHTTSPALSRANRAPIRSHDAEQAECFFSSDRLQIKNQ